MSETCPKCGRPKSPIDTTPMRPRATRVGDPTVCSSGHVRGGPEHSWVEASFPDPLCSYLAAAYERGMREGLAIAREWADPTWTSTPTNEVLTDIDWTDADAELERRVRGGE